MNTLDLGRVTQDRELQNRDLEQVTGGMTCQTAKNIAGGFWALSDFYHSVGMYNVSDYYDGKAIGVFIGGCDAVR